jgi:hypothetical protein
LSATVKASSGNVTLTGIGGGIGTSNEGIYVDSNATIQTAGLGNVTLTGDEIKLSGTTQVNGKGIYYFTAATTTTGKGNISLTGKAI